MGFDNLKNRFEERKKKSEGGSGNILFLKPDEKHYIRIIPRKLTEDEGNEKDPWVKQFKHVFVHYPSNNVVPKTTFSPKNWEEEDALGSFCQEQLDERQVGKGEFKFLINLKPNDCYITPAIKRGEEEKGARLFVMSQNQFETFIDALENAFLPDSPPEIWNPKEGFDLVVEVKSPEKTGKKYNETTITVSRNESSLNDDNLTVEDAKKILADQPLWDEAYLKKSNDELLAYLKNHLKNGSDASGTADVYDEDVEDDTKDSAWDDAFDDPDVDDEEVQKALKNFKDQQSKNKSEDSKPKSEKPEKEKSVDLEEEFEDEEELVEENPFD